MCPTDKSIRLLELLKRRSYDPEAEHGKLQRKSAAKTSLVKLGVNAIVEQSSEHGICASAGGLTGVFQVVAVSCEFRFPVFSNDSAASLERSIFGQWLRSPHIPRHKCFGRVSTPAFGFDRHHGQSHLVALDTFWYHFIAQSQMRE